MDQQKIGTFLKELRNEKNLTQEQLAEILGVSRRTVSRWETGSNLPDLDVLIEMVDYYDVDMRELLSGERKSEKMNKELEETVIMLADYSNEEKKTDSQNDTLAIHSCCCIIYNFLHLIVYCTGQTYIYFRTCKRCGTWNYICISLHRCSYNWQACC